MSPPMRRNGGPPQPPVQTSRHQAAPINRQDSGPGRLDDPELLIEVYRLVHPVLQLASERYGRVPGVGTPAWWAAPEDAKIAGLLVLSEAWCVCGPDRMVRERLKAMSVDLSEGLQDQRELIRRRRDAIGRALRNGDGDRAVELTNHHASDDWATVHPLESATCWAAGRSSAEGGRR